MLLLHSFPSPPPSLTSSPRSLPAAMHFTSSFHSPPSSLLPSAAPPPHPFSALHVTSPCFQHHHHHLHSSALYSRSCLFTAPSSATSSLGSTRLSQVTVSPRQLASATWRPLRCRVREGSSAGVEEESERGGAGDGDGEGGDEKLRALREVMRRADGGRGVDAFIIPSEDAHQSEYSAPCYERRAFIAGFTGSAGTAVVTATQAALWTDGRYFLQASSQLGADWQLMRAGMAGVPSINDWLRDSLPPNSRIGIDPFLHSADSVQSLVEAVRGSGVSVLPLLHEANLVDSVWGAERPEEGKGPLRVHPLEYAGETVGEKLSSMRQQMREAGVTALMVPMLDEVAWLLNIRGSDVPHCPVAYAYAAVEMEAAFLFVAADKVTAEVAAHLEEAGVTVLPYDGLIDYLRRAAAAGQRMWMDPMRVSCAVMKTFEAACADYYERKGGEERKGEEERRGEKKKKSKKGFQAAKESKGKGRKERRERSEAGMEGREEEDERGVFERNSAGPALIVLPSPIVAAKGKKNEAEIRGMKNAHLRDGAALAEFFSWMEEEIEIHGRQLSEVEVGQRLEQFRAKQQGFLDTSFDTIAGSGPNGAIIHYRAEAGRCSMVDGSNLFLLDSGGQYVDGTTDITRTVHFGTPSSHERQCFTRVLQGHIALDSAVFPLSTPGFVLDAFARSALWRVGLDYRHGTGHGVGAALNVHEGPHSISPRFGNSTGLEPGMVVSNEPGYYEDGAFGIRIENLLVVKEAATKHQFGGTTFLSFERLTFCPIQKRMLDVSLMSAEEIKWLNDYHQEVWTKISPLVSGAALEWLRRNTSSLGAPTLALEEATV